MHPPIGGLGQKPSTEGRHAVWASRLVLVWPDGSSRVLQPGDQIPAPAPSAALKASGSGIDLPAA